MGGTFAPWELKRFERVRGKLSRRGCERTRSVRLHRSELMREEIKVLGWTERGLTVADDEPI
jgi:hypothetical protein